MSDRRLTDAGDDEELTFEVVKPLGGVISVRFNGDEMLQLREEVRRRNTTVSGLIKEATLTHIAAANFLRQAAPTMQSEGAALLTGLWWTSNHSLSLPPGPLNTCVLENAEGMSADEPAADWFGRTRLSTHTVWGGAARRPPPQSAVADSPST